MKIAVDAMGGDHGLAPTIEGVVQVVRELGIQVILVGDQDQIRARLDQVPGKKTSIDICHASQTVGMHESPALVARKKRDSSIWVATNLIKSGDAQAVVSAGNTGATMVSAFFLLGSIKGIERPAIAASLPTRQGNAVMLDVGATVDCTAQQLYQFGIMGNEYGKHLLSLSAPRVGILSIGEEDTKGNEVSKEAFRLLKESPINFIGNVEGRDVYSGNADVIVCDGFIGNVALKISEGSGRCDEKNADERNRAVPPRTVGLPIHRRASLASSPAYGLCGIWGGSIVGSEWGEYDLSWSFISKSHKECH